MCRYAPCPCRDVLNHRRRRAQRQFGFLRLKKYTDTHSEGEERRRKKRKTLYTLLERVEIPSYKKGGSREREREDYLLFYLGATECDSLSSNRKSFSARYKQSRAQQQQRGAINNVPNFIYFSLSFQSQEELRNKKVTNK